MRFAYGSAATYATSAQPTRLIKTLDHSDRILQLWNDNADAWSTAVRTHSIESRKLVTDAAIIDAVLKRKPRTALDLGCGEGWLSRTLASHGTEVLGVDAIERLIELARAHKDAIRYLAFTYDQITAGAIQDQFDAIVCNFALFDTEPVEQLFLTIPKLLSKNGTFIVQTLHPVAACGSLPYQNGWREGSWSGCGVGFTEAPPWYFRTLETWQQLFEKSGLDIVETIEPMHPVTQQPASIIFAAQRIT